MRVLQVCAAANQAVYPRVDALLVRGQLSNALLTGILERGIGSGAFRQDLDPRLAASAILGSIGRVLGDYTRDRFLDELVRSLADLHQHMVAAAR